MLYLLLRFLGAFRSVYFLDYAGLSSGAIAAGVPLYFLAVSALLVPVAVLGRYRQIAAGRG